MQAPHHQRAGEQPDERSLGGLLADLSDQLTTLMRKEIELARLETGRKVTGMIRDTVWMSVGGALLYAGFLTLLAMVVILLADWMALWLAALTVAAIVLFVGGVLFLVGRNRLQKRDIKPTRTIVSLKENKRWLVNRQ